MDGLGRVGGRLWVGRGLVEVRLGFGRGTVGYGSGDGWQSVLFCPYLMNLVVSMTPGRHDSGTSSIHTDDVGLTSM